ncbi:VWA domain-containing protein [Candidatus Woesearchaeota archaeon]|nr:VWA domain-containing protein [Candidatus Woesearchaeota archaeon]
MEIAFNNQLYLWFLLSVPIVIIIHYLTNKYAVTRALSFANFSSLERVAKPPIISKHVLFLIVRLLTLGAIIMALAGASFFYIGQSSEFDFVIAMDTSSSMLAKDFTPNRLEATKEGTIRFIRGLDSKAKVGIVSFGGTTYIESFLTDDRDKLIEAVEKIEIKSIGGTDIGSAIVTATNILLSTEKSRAVLLISDGESNIGLSLEQAIEYANENNVAVHTIGIGTEEGGLFEEANIILKLDEESLIKIAEETGATYSRATDNENLFAAHERLASATTARKLSFNLSLALIVAAFILLFADWALISTKYRVIP